MQETWVQSLVLEACRSEGSPLREERLLGCLLHKAGRDLVSLYSHTCAEKATPSGKGVSLHSFSCVANSTLSNPSESLPSMLLWKSNGRS